MQQLKKIEISKLEYNETLGMFVAEVYCPNCGWKKLAVHEDVGDLMAQLHYERHMRHQISIRAAKPDAAYKQAVWDRLNNLPEYGNSEVRCSCGFHKEVRAQFAAAVASNHIKEVMDKREIIVLIGILVLFATNILQYALFEYTNKRYKALIKTNRWLISENNRLYKTQKKN